MKMNPVFSKCTDFEAKTEISDGKSPSKIPQKRFKLQWDRFENFIRAVLKTNRSAAWRPKAKRAFWGLRLDLLAGGATDQKIRP